MIRSTRAQPYMTMTELALEEVRKAILEGNLPPGCQLVPARLAKDLSLSQESIRDAIRQIVGSGLAESITNKGTFVGAPPSFEELKQIYKLRLHLEPEIAVRAADNITKREIDQLEDLIFRMEELARKSRSLSEHFILNREFHLTLYFASRWKALCQSVAKWLDQVLVFRSCLHDTKMYEDIDHFNEGHRQIMEVLKAGDHIKLRNFVWNNINSGLENIKKHYSEDLINKYLTGEHEVKEVVR